MSRKMLSYDEEAVFGNPSATLPIPDNSGATMKPVYADRANIETTWEPQIAQREVTRSGFSVETPRVISICDGTGVPYQRGMGQVSATIAGQTVGAGTADIPSNDQLPLASFLGSGMVDNGTPAGTAGLTFNPTGVVGQVLTVADAGGLEVGEILSVVINGITEYTAITYISPGAPPAADITINPGLSRTALITDDFYRMRMYYIPNGQLTPAESLFLRSEGDLWRQDANGCRPSQIGISVDEGEFIFDFTMEAPYIKADHTEASVLAGTNVVEPAVPAGPGSQPLGALQVLGTTPANDPTLVPSSEIASTEMDIDDISVSIALTLEKRGTTDTVLACREQIIVDATIEVDLTLSTPLSLVATDMLEKQNRLVMLGAGRCGEGTGIAIMMPCGAHMIDPELRLMDTELVRQSLKFSPRAPTLDDTTLGLGGLAGSIFRIGLGVVGA